jgi:hypothetical protein
MSLIFKVTFDGIINYYFLKLVIDINHENLIVLTN